MQIITLLNSKLEGNVNKQPFKKKKENKYIYNGIKY